jgi:arsenic resistance protein ArsH
MLKEFTEFEDVGRIKPSAYFNRMFDVLEELVKFTLLTCDIKCYMVDL